MARSRTLLLYIGIYSVLLSAISGTAFAQIVASYPFNGSANDVSGNGLNGSVVGATLTDDRFGNANSAYNFNGTSDYITVSSSSKLNFGGSTSFSVAAWVKFCSQQPKGSGSIGPFIAGKMKTSQTGTAAADQGYALTIAAGDQGGFYHHYAAAGTLQWEQSSLLNGYDNGQWHLLVGVADVVSASETKYSIYVDGNLEYSHTNLLANVHDFTSNTRPLLIGKDDNNTFFKGAIDDIQIYSNALSASDVSSMYNANGWSGQSPAIGGSITMTPSTAICLGDSVQLQLQTTGPVRKFIWHDGNGLRASDTLNPAPFVSPKSTATYTVDLYAAPPCEDVVSKKITVTVRESPKLAPGGVKYVCRGDSVPIGSSATGGTGPYQYAWTPTAGLSNPSTARPNASPGTSTKYYVTVTDAGGCTARDSVQVNLFEAPIVRLGADTTICRGSALTLNAEPTAPDNYTYAWTPKEGLSDTAVGKPIATPDKTTQYIAVVASSTGCIGRDTIIVKVNDVPTADAGRDTTICDGSAVAIGRKTEDRYTYAWDPVTGLDDSKIATPQARPTVTTTYTVTVTDTTGCSATDQVIVTVLHPKVEADPTDLVFGQLDGCTSSKELTLKVRNTGDVDIVVNEATTDNGSYSVVSPGRPFTVKAGEEVSVVIRFSPAGAGSASGSVTFKGSVGGGACEANLNVQLSGEKLQALVAADVSGVEFGRTLVCDNVEHDTTVTISNNGTADVTIGAGIVSAPYTIVSPTFPQTITAGASLVVTVRYAPVAAGVYVDDLKLPYESGQCRDTIRISLNGAHESPQATTVAAVDFGALSGCLSSRDTTIVVNNTGPVEIEVTAAQAPPGYKVLAGVPVRIPPGESRQITIQFAPVATGVAGGTLVLNYSPCAGVLNMNLTGEKQGVNFALADTLDFGELVTCEGTEKSLTLKVKYSGEGGADGTISGVTVQGPFETTITSGAALKNGVDEEFVVRYVPTSDGASSGWLELTLEPCGVKRRVELRGSRTSLDLAGTGVAFGAQNLGATISREVLFVNRGSAGVQVESIDGVTSPFALKGTTPVLPTVLRPGDTLHVEVTYVGTAGEQKSPVQAVVSAPCADLVETEVSGSGESGASAVIGLPVVSAKAGDHFKLPLVLRSSSGLDAVDARSYRAVVSFDQSLLVAADKSTATDDGITRRVELRGERQSGNDTLGEIEVIAVFGKAEKTGLKIEEFEWEGAKGAVETEFEGGEFSLDGICREGGVRLYDPSGEVVLKGATPNPGRGVVSIEYEVVEQGRTRLLVTDILGRRVAVVVDGEVDAGQYISWIDVSTWPTGQYVYTLETPTVVLSRRMEVVR